MTARRKLTVKGRGPDAHVTFYLETYRDKIWITSGDGACVCEAILEPAQADSLVELINQTAKQAREHGKSSS